MEEDVLHWLKILEVALIASIKFALAPFEAERYGFNFRESFIITSSGGIAGVFIFTFMGEVIAYGWRKLKSRFRHAIHKVNPPRRFKWSTRFIIRTKLRFGLLGIALITPSIMSIPVGTFIVHRFYRGKIRNILVLILFILLWSAGLNLLAQHLGLSHYLEQ